MDKNLLVVYNICGIKHDNIEMWVNHLQDIVDQKYNNFTVAISGCKISESSKKTLIEFKNKYKNVVFNFTDETLPVNVTFNHTTQICSSEFGTFDGYIYVASDVKFGTDYDVLTKLSHLHFSTNSAMTYALVDNDHGLDGWYNECWDELNQLLEKDHFCINIGKTGNMHVILFDKELYVKYDTKIIPDIFASHCTETTYSYLAASINKKITVHNKSVMLKHIGFADGHSVGFMDEIGWNHKLAWKHFFKCKSTAEERLLSNEAKEVGFGYVDFYGGFKHDSNLYDENENHIQPEKLFNFLKKSVYLSNEEFNYSEIKYSFIK
jgi:hypothetical protein